MNDSRTSTSICAETEPRRRYRIIDQSGHPSAPFTPKPGELGKLLAKAFPGQDEFELVEAK